jgi:uncharacterized protein (TIGR02996 family)
MPLWMWVDGMRGPVTATGYEHWIELQSYHFTVRRRVLCPPAFPLRHEALAASVSELVVTKDWGSESLGLFRWAVRGERRDVTLHRTVALGWSFQAVVAISLTAARLRRYDFSCPLGGEWSPDPMESLSLVYEGLTYEVHERRPCTCVVRGPQPAEPPSQTDEQAAPAAVTEETFLAALRQSPYDELTWSALADWLEENGHAARAAQVRLASKSPGDEKADGWFGEVERP